MCAKIVKKEACYGHFKLRQEGAKKSHFALNI